MIPELYWAPFVALVLLVLLVAFVREWVKPDVAAMVAVAALLVAGVLSAKDVVSVFGNSAPITIACLFIISGALSRTGCVDKLGEWLGNIAGNSERRLVLAVMLTCLLVSPFINNTPVVMVMIPAVIAIASRNGFAPSRILIPLSYATILGRHDHHGGHLNQHSGRWCGARPWAGTLLDV
jgi:Na+/H+ antiporter NhaD/arsenite permease-like protein